MAGRRLSTILYSVSVGIDFFVCVLCIQKVLMEKFNYFDCLRGVFNACYFVELLFPGRDCMEKRLAFIQSGDCSNFCWFVPTTQGACESRIAKSLC